MTSRKLALALATITLSAAVSLAAAVPSQAATAKPAPSPSPTPTPSPPPHALSCDDGTNGPGWLTGTFFIGAPGVTATTVITVLPNTADARRYLQLTEQQLIGQAQFGTVGTTSSAAPKPSLDLNAAFAQLNQQIQNAQAYAQLEQQLAPLTLSTSVDTNGNWACHGLAPGSYLMLAALSETSTQSTMDTKRLYFSNSVTVRQAGNDNWRTDVPLASWREIVEVAPPTH